MKHLAAQDFQYIPCNKILANWLTTSNFIYSDTTLPADLKALLRYEVMNKNRDMIVDRLTTRLLSLMKKEAHDEIRQDIKDIQAREREGVGEGHGEVPEATD